MILAIFILFSTCIRLIQPLEVLETDEFDILENWGIPRVKRQSSTGVEKDVISKFKTSKVRKKPCEELHQTKDSPFVAIVVFRSSGRLLCMGSIVDSQHILTSKICYDKIEIGDLLVVVGYFKPWWGQYSQVMKVKKIIRHEYVVAILKLVRKIRFTPNIQPTKLPPSYSKGVEKFETAFPPPYYIIGFFADRYDVPGEPFNKEKFYEIKKDTIANFAQCKKNYTQISLDATKLFCSIGNATFCWGGWGSPVLQWKEDKRYFLQVGVVVADNCTADTTGPFLVARTDVYADWIRATSSPGHLHKPS